MRESRWSAGSYNSAVEIYPAMSSSPDTPWQDCYRQPLFNQDGCIVYGSVVTQPSCQAQCAPNESCYLDGHSNCQTKCIRNCTLSCSSGQTCGFSGSSMVCVPLETFDAGVVTITGLAQSTLQLNTAIELSKYPGQGKLFSTSSARAYGPGTSNKGIGAFDISGSPPPEVVATPSLSTLSKSSLASGLTLRWTPGTDQAEVFLYGSGNGKYLAARCSASDSSGQRVIPKALIDLLVKDAFVLQVDLFRTRKFDQPGAQVKGGTWYGVALPANAVIRLKLVRVEAANIPL